jgi:hypothetical protein
LLKLAFKHQKSINQSNLTFCLLDMICKYIVYHSAPFLQLTKPGLNTRRIGDRLVWVARYNDLTHWAIRAPYKLIKSTNLLIILLKLAFKHQKSINQSNLTFCLLDMICKYIVYHTMAE